MNRSFRAPDSKMPPSLHQRPGVKLGSVMKEKEEELALFLEMRKREKGRQNLLIHNADELDPTLGSKTGSSPVFKIATSTAPGKIGSDDFLNSEGEKNDYDWLLTPPGTPLFPSLEKESHGSVTGQLGTPKVRPTALKSRRIVVMKSGVDDTDEDFVFYGTPIQREEELSNRKRKKSEDSGSMRSLPTWKQEVLAHHLPILATVTTGLREVSVFISRMRVKQNGVEYVLAHHLPILATVTTGLREWSYLFCLAV